MKMDPEGTEEVGWAWLFLNRTLNLVYAAVGCTLIGNSLEQVIGLLLIALMIVNLLHRIMHKQNLLEEFLRLKLDAIKDELAWYEKSSAVGRLSEKLDAIESKMRR